MSSRQTGIIPLWSTSGESMKYGVLSDQGLLIEHRFCFAAKSDVSDRHDGSQGAAQGSNPGIELFCKCLGPSASGQDQVKLISGSLFRRARRGSPQQ
jgi:hypothetical protein